MANAVKDANSVSSMLATYNGSTVQVKCEHVTGYIKAKIIGTTLSAPTVDDDVSQKDANSVSSILGDYNGTPKTLKVTHADGYLRAVIA